MNIYSRNENQSSPSLFPAWPSDPNNDLWMCGMTPPPAIVPLIRISSS